MTTSVPHPEPILCNTTPTRYFALSGQTDVLAAVSGGAIRVPRPVFDPDEDPDHDQPELLSELGGTQRFYSRRSQGAEAIELWFRIQELRSRSDIEVVDMTDAETVRFAEFQSREIQRRFGLAARLGPGEAAVMAIAEERDWTAAIDDWGARQVLQTFSPATTMLTTRELVRMGVAAGELDTPDAEDVYQTMLDLGYRGPNSLWN